ncbi:MAG TPA: hypothetical protein VE261_06425, partial [Gaiellaceae bacterium]|nr:hypothetical protein [Gaiellaceae bacterium]
GAPEALSIDLVQGKTAIDFTTVSAAQFKVKRADGTISLWSATLSNQTATTLRVSHTFASGDVTAQDRCVGVAHLTVPGGVVRSVPFPIEVRDEFELPW